MPGLRYGVKFPGKQSVLAPQQRPDCSGYYSASYAMGIGVLFIGLKLPERETNLCSLSWRYKGTFTYVFMTCLI